jgi:hypothetical protein
MHAMKTKDFGTGVSAFTPSSLRLLIVAGGSFMSHVTSASGQTSWSPANLSHDVGTYEGAIKDLSRLVCGAGYCQGGSVFL